MTCGVQRVFFMFLTLAMAAGQERLQVENRVDPLGVDETAPRLSWNVPAAAGMQYAYQVHASSGATDLWDSGMVISTVASGIVYAGPALRSRQRVTWRVRVWTGD